MGRKDPALSSVLVHLFKGAVYADSDALLWKDLLEQQPQVRDYIAVLGLDLTVNEAEGYAFLRDEVLQATAEDGYFAWVERLAEKIPTMTDPITEARLLMPEGTGLGLRNVQNPTSY